MCQLDFDEMASVWDETQVKARKAHRCDCCDGPILPGEVYLKHFSLHDGYVCSEKVCAACRPMRAAFLAAHGSTGTPGSMRPLLDQCIEAEADEGHEDVAERWREELRAMDARKAAAR